MPPLKGTGQISWDGAKGYLQGLAVRLRLSDKDREYRECWIVRSFRESFGGLFSQQAFVALDKIKPESLATLRAVDTLLWDSIGRKTNFRPGAILSEDAVNFGWWQRRLSGINHLLAQLQFEGGIKLSLARVKGRLMIITQEEDKELCVSSAQMARFPRLGDGQVCPGGDPYRQPVDRAPAPAGAISPGVAVTSLRDPYNWEVSSTKERVAICRMLGDQFPIEFLRLLGIEQLRDFLEAAAWQHRIKEVVRVIDPEDIASQLVCRETGEERAGEAEDVRVGQVERRYNIAELLPNLTLEQRSILLKVLCLTERIEDVISVSPGQDLVSIYESIYESRHERFPPRGSEKKLFMKKVAATMGPDNYKKMAQMVYHSDSGSNSLKELLNYFGDFTGERLYLLARELFELDVIERGDHFYEASCKNGRALDDFVWSYYPAGVASLYSQFEQHLGLENKEDMKLFQVMLLRPLVHPNPSTWPLSLDRFEDKHKMHTLLCEYKQEIAWMQRQGRRLPSLIIYPYDFL